MKYTKKIRVSLVILIVLILAFGTVLAGASTLTNNLPWDGQGSDSLRCDKLGESPERTADGWIHWIVTQATGVTQAELVLGGSGSGTYAPTKYGPVVEFFTPYFDVDTLTATLHYDGTLDGNTQFVISDYCPGVQENLDVSKTVVTSYEREHFWDIKKEVVTEEGYEIDDIAKIWLYIDGTGDETATWTIDVTYEGYEDSNFNVSGVITIENTGKLDAVIESIVDTIFFVPEDYSSENLALVEIECDVKFPYELKVGETLTCNYSFDFAGKTAYADNTITVTTERDVYSATEPIIWGDPTVEINKTVNIKDISDLFGEVDLGTATAPNNAQFTYSKDFAWADYGAELGGSYQYDNTATIIETEQSASASLKVNVQEFIYESAWAKGDDAISFCEKGFNNWGWTNPIIPGEYVWELWAGAAQCDIEKGTLVGSVTVVYDDDDGYVVVTFNVEDEYDLKSTAVYAGYDMFPKLRNGEFTIAPGQYRNNGPFGGSEVYVIAHANVGHPDPDFGPEINND